VILTGHHSYRGVVLVFDGLKMLSAFAWGIAVDVLAFEGSVICTWTPWSTGAGCGTIGSCRFADAVGCATGMGPVGATEESGKMSAGACNGKPEIEAAEHKEATARPTDEVTTTGVSERGLTVGVPSGEPAAGVPSGEPAAVLSREPAAGASGATTGEVLEGAAAATSGTADLCMDPKLKQFVNSAHINSTNILTKD
jgi:hypothetical protein